MITLSRGKVRDSMKPHEGRKRRWGDRKDGFLVRNLDPMTKIEPYIMPSKLDAWVLFEDRIDITHTEEFIREHSPRFRTEDAKDIFSTGYAAAE